MKAATKAIAMTKQGKVSKIITNALEHCRFDEGNKKIYTGYYSGRGRFTSRHTAYRVVADLLHAEGYKFTEGNDSDRNGASGEFVQVYSSTAMKAIMDIKNYNKNYNPN